MTSTTSFKLPAFVEPLDGAVLRNDFPILNQPQTEGRSSLVFLDSAASSQKPQDVIDAVTRFYESSNANIHRGVYELSERATGLYEEAREKVAAFINAPSARQCIFVRNTTEAINLVAQSWGRQNLKQGDTVLLTLMDHHSNIVPWHLLAEQIGFEVLFTPLTADQRIDMAGYKSLLDRKPRLVAFPHVSNALGTINDVPEMIPAWRMPKVPLLSSTRLRACRICRSMYRKSIAISLLFPDTKCWRHLAPVYFTVDASYSKLCLRSWAVAA